MLRLRGTVQHYDWGRVGEDSAVAGLYALSSGIEIDQSKPYAELWMGTHPSGPSFLLEDDSSPPEQGGVLLNEWLQKNPDALGEAVLKRWQGELPFLFKVLSVAKALSIQAHPDKRLAEELFQTHPKVYKDANHKPEMALALTQFEALCGFMGSDELKLVLEAVPELRNLLNESDVTQLLNVTPSESPTAEIQAALQRAFTTLMTLDKQTVAKSVRTLIARLTKEKDSRTLLAREELLLNLEKQYPDDVGVLASLFLNHIVLKPGEAVYLAANVPHAYISGECVECMATSDNVVRAGLTPKFRDTATLSSMLTYEQGIPDLLDGYSVSLFTRRYSPPFEEFEVDLITVPCGDSLDFAPISGPSIFLVSDGKGTVVFSQDRRPSMVKKGDIFFLPAGKEFRISAEAIVDVNGHSNGHGHGNGHENGNGHGNGNGNGHGNGNGSAAMPSYGISLYRAGVNSSFL